jgi:2'-5' RNA ligase
LPVQAIEPIDWEVDSFALIESVTAPEGPCYQVLERWSLQRTTA